MQSQVITGHLSVLSCSPARRRQSIAQLIANTTVTAISAMHAACASSLQARPTRQRAPELQQCARDLVAHGGMALLVVDARGADAGAVVLGGAGRGGGSGGLGHGVVARLVGSGGALRA